MEVSKESFRWQNVRLGSNHPMMKIPKTKGEAGLLPITGVELVGSRPYDTPWIGSRQCFDWQVRGNRKRSFLCYLVDFPSYGKVIQVFGNFGSLPAGIFSLVLVFDLFWSTESGVEGVKSKWPGGLRGILGQVALAEVFPETCPNVSEAGSGFSCELNSLPTKEEQPGLLAKSKSEISSRPRTKVKS